MSLGRVFFLRVRCRPPLFGKSRRTVYPSVYPLSHTKKNGLRQQCCNPLIFMAEWTGLEPATPGVTGRYSNQLNYHSTR